MFLNRNNVTSFSLVITISFSKSRLFLFKFVDMFAMMMTVTNLQKHKQARLKHVVLRIGNPFAGPLETVELRLGA